MRTAIAPLAIIALVASCSQPSGVNLSTSLRGIQKSKFLACSGPPSLEYDQGGQDRMSFVTNLQRGQAIGIAGPTAFPVESCSVDAVFEHDRLVSSSFSGNPAMCNAVFAPCFGR
jgi:hypothetical protein